MARADRFTLSVRIYVMRPASYSLCATIIVWLTVNPSFLAASCCRVEVVKGGAGVRFSGFLAMDATLNLAFLHSSRNARASSWVLNRLFSSAFTSFFEPSSLVTAKTAFRR